MWSIALSRSISLVYQTWTCLRRFSVTRISRFFQLFQNIRDDNQAFAPLFIHTNNEIECLRFLEEDQTLIDKKKAKKLYELTQQRHGVRSRWHCLGHHIQEHSKGQENGYPCKRDSFERLIISIKQLGSQTRLIHNWRLETLTVIIGVLESYRNRCTWSFLFKLLQFVYYRSNARYLVKLNN